MGFREWVKELALEGITAFLTSAKEQVWVNHTVRPGGLVVAGNREYLSLLSKSRDHFLRMMEVLRIDRENVCHGH